MEEMGDFLVKIHINKMNPKRRKIHRAISHLEPLPPTGFLLVQGFPSPDDSRCQVS